MRIHGPILAAFLTVSATAHADSAAQTFPLANADGLRAHKVVLGAGEFEGRRAVRLTMLSDFDGGDNATLAVVEGTDFHDGTIEFDLASGINPDSWFFVKWIARGFAGIAFRIDPDLEGFESIYLRPENGRAEDEVRRSHAVQYFSYPGYGFQRFREEAPGKYEAPADIGPNEWIHVRVVVTGERAALYLDDEAKPTLVVNDLKRGPDTRGAIGLYIDAGTRAWFSNLRVTPAD